MADPIVYNVVIQTEVRDAGPAAREVNRMRGQLGNLERQAGRTARAADNVGGGLGDVGTQSRTATRDVRGLQRGLGGLNTSLSASAGLLDQVFFVLGARAGIGGFQNTINLVDRFNKELLVSRSFFLKYGQGVDQTEAKIESLAESLKFSRFEVARWQKQFETSFRIQPPDNIERFIKSLTRVVGRNEEAISELFNTITSGARGIPEVEFLINANLDEKGILESGALKRVQDLLFVQVQTGQMDFSSLKRMLDYTTAMQIGADALSQADRERFQELEKQRQTVLQVQKAVEDITLFVGQDLLPKLKGISDFIDRNKMSIASIAKIVLPIITGLSIIGAVTTIGAGLGALGGAAGRMIGLGRKGGKGAGAAGAAGALGGAAGMGPGGAMPVWVVNMPGAFSPIDGWDGARRGATRGAPAAAGRFGRLGGFVRGGGLAGALGLGTAGTALMGAGGGLGGSIGGGALYELFAPEGRADKTVSGAVEKGFSRALGGAAVGTAVAGPIGTAIGFGVGGLHEAYDISRDIYDINSQTKDIIEQGHARMQSWLENIKQTGTETQIRLAESFAAIAEKQDELDTRRASIWNQLFGDSSETKKIEEQVERMRQNYANMRKELQPKLETERRIREEVENEAEELRKIQQIRLATLAYIELEKGLVESQNRLLQEQSRLYDGLIKRLSQGAFFSADSLGQAETFYQTQRSEIERTILAQQNLLRTQMDARSQLEADVDRSGLTDMLRQARTEFDSISDPQARAAALARYTGEIRAVIDQEQQIVSTQAGIIDNQNKLNMLAAESTKWLDHRVGLQQKEAGLLEAQVSLADNFALGVAASAEMRMQLVRQLGDVIGEQRNKLMLIEDRMAQAQDAVMQGRISEQDYAAQMVTLEQERLQTQTDILQNVNKQAQMTRVLRDGWVDAINAMNNGVGMFTKIKIDRDTRLGTLMERAPNPIVGIRTGFSGPGRREAPQYSAMAPGMLTNPDTMGRAFGAGTDEWARAIDRRSPMLAVEGVNPFSPNSAGQLASGFSLWQELVGQNLNTTLAAGAETPFGLSGLTSEVSNDSIKSISNAVREGARDGIEMSSLGRTDISTEGPVEVIIKGVSGVLPVSMQGAIARNEGGFVPGPLGQRQDSVPAFLTPREFVVRREAADVIGPQLLEMMNNGQITNLDQYIEARAQMMNVEAIRQRQRSREFFDTIDTSGISGDNLTEQLRETQAARRAANDRLRYGMSLSERMESGNLAGTLSDLDRLDLRQQIERSNEHEMKLYAAIAKRQLDAEEVAARSQETVQPSRRRRRRSTDEQPQGPVYGPPAPGPETVSDSSAPSVPTDPRIASWLEDQAEELERFVERRHTEMKRSMLAQFLNRRDRGENVWLSQEFGALDELMAQLQQDLKRVSSYDELKSIAGNIGAPVPSIPDNLFRQTVGPQLENIATGAGPMGPQAPGTYMPVRGEFDADRFAKDHPELADQLRNRAIGDFEEVIQDYRQREVELRSQLGKAGPEGRERIAGQRRSNRARMQEAQQKLRMLNRGMMIPELAALMERQFDRQYQDQVQVYQNYVREQQQSQLEELRRQQDLQALQDPGNFQNLLGELRGGDKWWNDPSVRSEANERAPKALTNPPTRQSAPAMFAALDVATSLPSGYDTETYAIDEWANQLREIMSNSDGLSRNQALRSFSDEMNRNYNDNTNRYIPAAQKKLQDQQERLRQMMEVEFAPLSDIERQKSFIANTERDLAQFQAFNPTVRRMSDFANAAYIPLIEAFQDRMELEGYMQDNEGRRPGERPRYLENRLQDADRQRNWAVQNWRKEQEAWTRDANIAGWLMGAPLLKAMDYAWFDNSIRDDLIRPAMGGDAAIERARQIMREAQQEHGILLTMPTDMEGLRGVYYGSAMREAASGLRPGSKSGRVLGEKLDALRSLIYGGDYESYRGQVMPMLESINDYVTGRNLSEGFTKPYRDFVSSPTVDWSQYDIPQFAKGGYVPATPGGQLAVIGEGGQNEIVSPEPRLAAMARDAASRATSGAGVGSMMAAVDAVTGGADFSGGDTHKVQVELSPKQMSDLKESLIREASTYMRGVAEAAMAKVVNDMTNGA